jgi:hypothetical protein
MKRSLVALGVLVITFFVTIHLAIWKAKQAPDTAKQSITPSEMMVIPQTPVEEMGIATSTTTSREEEEKDFSRDPLIYSANRWDLEVRLPDGASTTHHWRLGDVDKLERAVFAAEVVRSAEPSLPECRVRLWLREGPLSGAYGSQTRTGEMVYEVAGNERGHVLADSLDLCGTVISYGIGSDIQATHLIRRLPGTDVSGSCHDFQLDWKDATGKKHVMKSVVQSLFGGKQVVSEGGCMPYSLTTTLIPNSENVLVSRRMMGFSYGGIGDDPVALLQKRSEKILLSYDFLAPLEYKTLSPDGRYLFGVDLRTRMPVESALETQAIVVYDLATAKTMTLRVGDIPPGRWVGAPFSDQDPSTTPPVVRWTGPRSLEVMTINPILSSIEAQKRSVLLVTISF